MTIAPIDADADADADVWRQLWITKKKQEQKKQQQQQRQQHIPFVRTKNVCVYAIFCKFTKNNQIKWNEQNE